MFENEEFGKKPTLPRQKKTCGACSTRVWGVPRIWQTTFGGFWTVSVSFLPFLRDGHVFTGGLTAEKPARRVFGLTLFHSQSYGMASRVFSSYSGGQGPPSDILGESNEISHKRYLWVQRENPRFGVTRSVSAKSAFLVELEISRWR